MSGSGEPFGALDHLLACGVPAFRNRQRPWKFGERVGFAAPLSAMQVRDPRLFPTTIVDLISH
jgi:hypothetical protein